MTIMNLIKDWKDKEVLIVGEAVVDKYILGYADKISPDAPVPNIKVEQEFAYLGGIGLTLQFIKSLGGIPKICTVVGKDYDGDFYIKKLKDLKINTSNIIIDKSINTPQITRIKAMNQHLLRLETDYTSDISDNIKQTFLKKISSISDNISSILILDYGIGGLFDNIFIQTLINELKLNYKNIPIIARPNLSNYYIYEGIDLIKMNRQKALHTISIDCCTETSISIIGKRILNTTKSKNILLNYIESDSYLYTLKEEKVKRFPPIIQTPVSSYISVGSVIMAILGLCYAAKIPVSDSVNIALYGATLTATLHPVEFFDVQTLSNFISEYEDTRL